MTQAGQKLNLQLHVAGLFTPPDGFQYAAPGDIEGHLGYDSRFYVLDFARTFPPEARLKGDPEERGAPLYKLLRPELVRLNLVPLNPDAFTSANLALVSSTSRSDILLVWTAGDPKRIEYATAVRAATYRLRTEVTKNF